MTYLWCDTYSILTALLVPIDDAKETQKERQPLLWDVFLLALGYSKRLCELSNALTDQKRECPAVSHPQAMLNGVQVSHAGAVRVRVDAARLALPENLICHRYYFMSWQQNPSIWMPQALTSARFLTYLHRRVKLSFAWNLLIRTVSQLGSFESPAGITNPLGQDG